MSKENEEQERRNQEAKRQLQKESEWFSQRKEREKAWEEYLKNEKLERERKRRQEYWERQQAREAYQKYAQQKQKKQCNNQTVLSPIEKVDKMTGAQFEEFMATYFRQKGYDVIKTKLSGDFGIDLIIENKIFRCGVQLKRYSKKVSLKAVQEVIGGLEHYKLDQGMVITNNYFQQSAITLAGESSKPITLWNRDILIQKLGK